MAQASLPVLTEIEPPRRLAFSFGKPFVVSFELKDLGGKTEFTLIQSDVKAYWANIEKFWDNQLDALKRYIEDTQPKETI